MRSELVCANEAAFATFSLIPRPSTELSLASFPDHQLSFSLVSFPDQRSGYTLCPGIRSYEEEFAETIRFQSKNLRIWCHPAVRHDSNQCLLWHKPNKFQLQSTSLIGLIPRPSTELFRPFHCLQCAKFIMYFT